MKKKKERNIKRVIIPGITLSVIMLFLLFQMNKRSHSYWYVSQQLINGDLIELKFDSSSRIPLFSFPDRHPSIIIGGGDYRIDVYFSYKGQKHHFESIGAPVLINYWKNQFYIVSVAWEGIDNDRRPFLKFYRFENRSRLKEISPEKFPKSIAIPNIDYIMNYPEIEKPEIINPDLKDFRLSLIARLWLRLEKGVPYHETEIRDFKPYEVDKNFLIEYKKKYIDPYWSEQALKDNYPKVLQKNKANSRNR